MKLRSSSRWTTSVVMTVVLISSSCTTSSSDAPQKEPACVRDRTPYSLDTANYADVGKPGDTKGTSRPFVVVFGELHPSRVGQVEIAIMLNRLHRSANLRHVGLEGSVLEKPAPNVDWFTSLPDERIRTEVALRLLREGEVSAAEFAAMTMPGVQLHPIEHASEYQVDAAGSTKPFTGYLVAIALMSLTTDQTEHAAALLKDKKNDEAIQFIVDTNPWTSERYKLVYQTKPIPTTEQMRTLGDELEAKARSVGADVSASTKDFQAARAFYTTAVQRSATMAATTADLAAARVGDCAPIAMDIGAAHITEVTGALSQRNTSYAVVSPSSLELPDDGRLSPEAYERKNNNKSVDPAGGLGTLLDSRRKPAPIVQEEWFMPKAQIMYAIAVIARAANTGGAIPPFGLDQNMLGLGGSGPERPAIAIDLSSISVVQVGTDRHDVIFQVKLLKTNATFWVRAGVDSTATQAPQTLENELLRMRDELKKENQAEDPKPSDKPQVIAIADDVKAAIATTKSDLESVKLY